MKLRSILVLAVTGFVLSVAAPALATTYGTRAAPVKAEHNSDDGNAWFYGAVTLSQMTQIKNAYYFRDSAPGGNDAYVTTDWYFWLPCTDGSSCYDHRSEDRSSSDDSGDWIDERDYVNLHPRSDKGRAMTRVCEDQAWAFDDCSKYVTVTLGY